ncbi:MAG: transglutaminase-like domain-containing protein [Nitrospiraceae bacterium]|nr:transglutaminase-like domain-containing protein [Nitrospiraceae bacterium]
MNYPAVFRKAAYAGIVALWIAATAALVARHYRAPHTGKQASVPVVLPDQFFGERWMGIYFGGRKIGYSRGTFDKMKGGYKMSESTTLRLTVMGSVKEVRTDTEASLSPSLLLESFHAKLMADADLDVHGTVRGKELLLTIKTAGGSSSRVVPLPRDPSLGVSMLPALFAGGIAKGKRVEITSFDPASLSQQQVSVEVVGKEETEAGGTVFDAYKLKGSLGGTDFFLWLSEKGELLKEESPAGFTLVREDRAEAQKDIGASADLVTQASLPFNLRLPPLTQYLKVRISGLDPAEFSLNGGRQHFVRGVLEIVREDLKSGAGRRETFVNGHAGENGALRDSAFIQSKDKRIVSLASDIVRGEKDRLKAARLICDWVYRNIGKTPSVTFPTAVDVFLTRKGDCNEHTTLYTALARAAGIPTRMAAGLVYKDGRLFYHAWPEIFAESWIAVDPTFGQFPADAAHIRLVTGDVDQQTKLIRVIGKIRIEGIAYR